MDAIFHVANVIATYAALIAQNMAIGGIVLVSLLGMAMMHSPDTVMVACLLLALAIGWHFFKPVRRVLRWYLFWPIGRLFYRVVRRPVRLLLGGIMARWKTGIVADKLDDAMMELHVSGVLSKQEYRRLSNLIGKALGIGDLVTKKINPKGIEHTVLENIGLMKLTPPVPGPPRKVEVDPSYNPTTGRVLNLSFLRRRNNAA